MWADPRPRGPTRKVQDCSPSADICPTSIGHVFPRYAEEARVVVQFRRLMRAAEFGMVISQVLCDHFYGVLGAQASSANPPRPE